MALSCALFVTVLALNIGFLACFVGYITPFWLTDHMKESGKDSYIDIFIGLLFTCANVPKRSYEKCELIPWEVNVQDDTYFKVLRVLIGASLLLMIVGKIVGIVACCKRHPDCCVFLLATVSLLGGVTGLTGLIIFAVYTDSLMKYNPFVGKIEGVNFENLDLRRSWSFYMSCAASAYVVVVSILVAAVSRCTHGYKFSNALSGSKLDLQNDSISMKEKSTEGTDNPMFT